MSLYAPFTSPPKLPHQRHARPTGASAQDKRWGGPQIADTRTKPRHDNLGSVPPLVVNMQVKESLAMRQRMSRQVDLGQLRAVDMRVDLCGRNVGMSQNLL